MSRGPGTKQHKSRPRTGGSPTGRTDAAKAARFMLIKAAIFIAIPVIAALIAVQYLLK